MSKHCTTSSRSTWRRHEQGGLDPKSKLNSAIRATVLKASGCSERCSRRGTTRRHRTGGCGLQDPTAKDLGSGLQAAFFAGIPQSLKCFWIVLRVTLDSNNPNFFRQATGGTIKHGTRRRAAGADIATQPRVMKALCPQLFIPRASKNV